MTLCDEWIRMRMFVQRTDKEIMKQKKIHFIPPAQQLLRMLNLARKNMLIHQHFFNSDSIFPFFHHFLILSIPFPLSIFTSQIIAMRNLFLLPIIHFLSSFFLSSLTAHLWYLSIDCNIQIVILLCGMWYEIEIDWWGKRSRRRRTVLISDWLPGSVKIDFRLVFDADIFDARQNNRMWVKSCLVMPRYVNVWTKKIYDLILDKILP